MNKLIIGVLAALTLSGASLQAFSADSAENSKVYWETVTTGFGYHTANTPEELCDKGIVAANAGTYSGYEYAYYEILDYFYSHPEWKYGDGYLACFFQSKNKGDARFAGAKMDIRRVSTN